MIKQRLIYIVFVMLFANCAFAQFDPKSPVKEPKSFNDKSYNFFLSKRLKSAIHQRDSLYDLVVAFNKDTTMRGKEYRYLDSLYRALTAMYDDCTEKNNALKITPAPIIYFLSTNTNQYPLPCYLKYFKPDRQLPHSCSC